MKRITLSAFFLLSAMGIFAQIIDRPVAIVNLHKREVVTQKQLIQKVRIIEEKLRQPMPDAQRKALLDAQVTEILINQAAEKENILVAEAEVQKGIENYKRSLGFNGSETEFKVLIEKESEMKWDEFVKSVRTRLVQEKYITEKKRSLFQEASSPTDTQILQVFNANSTQFTNPEIIQFSQVFIDTRSLGSQEKNDLQSKAEGIYKEIQSGKLTMDQAIARYGNDPASRIRGDAKAFLARNDAQRQKIMGGAFFEALFATRPGQVSRVLESNVGYHIVRVQQVLPRKFLNLDDPVAPDNSVTVRQYIRNQLIVENQQRTFQRALNEITEELKKKAEVRIFEENLSW